jgi:hypothetical protein
MTLAAFASPTPIRTSGIIRRCSAVVPADSRRFTNSAPQSDAWRPESQSTTNQRQSPTGA